MAKITPPAAAASGTTQTVTTRTATGTTDSLIAGDANNVIEYTNASAVTVTVTKSATVAWVADTIVQVYAGGAGGVTLVADTGVTIRNNTAPLVQYQEVSLRYRGSDEWVRVG